MKITHKWNVLPTFSRIFYPSENNHIYSTYGISYTYCYISCIWLHKLYVSPFISLHNVYEVKSLNGIHKWLTEPVVSWKSIILEKVGSLQGSELWKWPWTSTWPWPTLVVTSYMYHINPLGKFHACVTHIKKVTHNYVKRGLPIRDKRTARQKLVKVTPNVLLPYTHKVNGKKFDLPSKISRSR